MQKEIWKDIKGYERLYEVSNLGRVKSLDRMVDNGLGGEMHIKERILTNTLTNRYYIVILSNKKKKVYRVHKLVAIAFLNHVPNGHKIVVDHIDHNPLNNNLSNIQLITERENLSKDKYLKNPNSKKIGVFRHKKSKKWFSQISINKKSKYLGTFNNEIDAHNAYKKALTKLL